MARTRRNPELTEKAPEQVHHQANPRRTPRLSATALQELHDAADRGWISTETLDQVCDGGPDCPHTEKG
jgi:hypothetical protein